MNKKIFIIVFIISLSQFIYSQKKDTIQIWTWLLCVHDVDLKEQNIDLDFYITYKFKKELENKYSNIYDQIEINRSRITEITYLNKSYSENMINISCKVHVVLSMYFNLGKYPFDKQKINITMENTQYNTSDLVLISDYNEKSEYEKDFFSPNWKIKNPKSYVFEHIWNWTGKISNKKFSQYIFSFEIKRKHSLFLFVKSFFPLFVGIFISLFSVSLKEKDWSFKLSMASLIMIVSSYFTLHSYIPLTISFADILFLFSLLTISFIMQALAPFEESDLKTNKMYRLLRFILYKSKKNRTVRTMISYIILFGIFLILWII